jgi:hypothetical protein
MAFWFGVTSMIRSASLESSSIPQTSSRNMLPALMSSLPSALLSSTTHQPQHRQNKPQQLPQGPTRYQQPHNPPPNSLVFGHLPLRNRFSVLFYNQQGQISLQPTVVQRLQSQAPASSRCSYCLTGTGFDWAPDDDHVNDHEVVDF